MVVLSRFYCIVLSICLICAVLFINIKIGSYGTIHLFLLPLIFITFLFPKKEISSKALEIDRVSRGILILGLWVFIGFLINARYASDVEQTYFYTSGNLVPFLYYKICLNGSLYFFIIYFAYRFGVVVSSDRNRIKNLILLVVILTSINSFANLCLWLIQTGGAIGRYNFDTPITGSPGISAQLSTIGFFLGLALLKYYDRGARKLLLLVMMLLLFSNIVIIFTRQSQVTFFIIGLFYYLISKKITFVRLFTLICLGTVVLTLFIGFITLSGNSDVYLSVNSTEATDVTIRFITISSAWDMFVNNPIFGIGFGMFSGHNKAAIYITGVETYLASPHNGFFAILAEVGVLGMIIYLIMNIIVLSVLNKTRKNLTDPFLKHLSSLIFIMQLIWSLSFFISNSNLFGPPSEYSYMSMSFISWILIGIVIGSNKVKQIEI